jgi:S1-C subfamily serine protease
MVDYLNNFRKSASRGLPVYGLGGGEGFVWIAAFDANGKGKLRFFAADPSDMIHISTHYADAPPESAKPQSPMEPKSSSPSSAPLKGEQTSGTGFFVPAEGHIVTNAHVVRGCVQRSVTMSSALPVTARVLAEDVANDLALLKVEAKPAAVATLRAGVKIGEKIAVFGFPLVGVLSTKGNFTEGNISALTGIRDDTAFLQISAPVQPGNSGGPVLDGSGNVVGVVVSQFDAIKFAEATQDVPQNVNFAIKTTVLINFLDANGVSFTTGNLGQAMLPADLAERGKSISVLVVCEE